MAKQYSKRARRTCGTRLQSWTGCGSASSYDTYEATEECVVRIRRIGGGRGVAAQNKSIRGARGEEAVQYEARIPQGEDDFAGAGVRGRATLDLHNVTRPKRGQHALAANFGVNIERGVGAEIGAAAHDVRDQGRAYDVPTRR